VTIFFSWFFKNAVLKSKPLITKTPLLVPLLLYTSLFIISTFIGILKGNISFYKSFFYVLKYVEYFLLYFMCVNIIEPEDIKKYSRYWLWIFIGVTLYAYYYYFNAVGGDVRTTAPFEAPLNSPRGAEPASLGGFYLIAFSFLLALMKQYGGKIFVYAVSFFVLAFPAFTYTFSRASYMGLVVIFVVFLFLGRERRIFGILMAIGLTVFIAVMPATYQKVESRIKNTYSGEYATYKIRVLGADLQLEESAYMRYASLITVLTKHLPESPLVGKGVTGVGLGDNQYSLLLGEIGVLGFFAFWFWIFKIYGMASEVYKKSGDPLFKSVALGVTMALSGLLVQGIGVNTFIIVRIMEPFWFIVAVLTVVYGNLEKSQAIDKKIGKKVEK